FTDIKTKFVEVSVFISQMGRKCCVPSCVTNVTFKTAGSCFRFPSNAQRKEIWLRAIPRDDPFNTDYTGVCIQHFDSKFIATHTTEGLPLAAPWLTKDAIPSVFEYTADGVPDMFYYDPDTVRKNDGWLTTASEDHLTFYKLKLKPGNNLIVDMSVDLDCDLNIKSFSQGELIDMKFYGDILTRHRHLTLFSQLNVILVKCNSELPTAKPD
ncbi:hypothetical protein Bhyg_03323, partial [Pseudolycoriella hygida]